MLRKLTDCCESIDYGFTQSSSAEEIGPHFLRITDIDPECIDWESVPYCEASPAERNKYALAAGDIVVARTGASTGNSRWIESPHGSVFASYLVRLVARPEVNSRYLSYVLKGAQWNHYVSSISSSKSAQPNMSASAMGQFTFEIHSLPEQQAIAEVLGALDDKIAANRKLVTTSLTLAEAVHDLALSDEQRPLGDFMEFAYGKSLPATRRIPGEVPVVGSGGVTGSHDEALVNRPGIVVGRKGSMGTVRWMDEPFFPIDTTFYVTNKTGIPDQFWYFSLKQARFEGLNSDSAVPGLNREAALEQLTRTPSESGIKRFEDVALPLFELATANRRESQTLSQLRDTLLPALMDGTIRVKDAERLAEEAV